MNFEKEEEKEREWHLKKSTSLPPSLYTHTHTPTHPHTHAKDVMCQESPRSPSLPALPPYFLFPFHTPHPYSLTQQ